ncbi:MAG TPA: Xaa-Pro peptidase family protein [Patescibacteria group bacterium]|nr:Xaa-Pro peptidase family protein [Patescibacteria group bacterium]
MSGNRIKILQENLVDYKIDALLVSSAINIQYLTGYSNFSKDEREAYLFVTGTSATLFTDSRYIEAVEKIIPKNVNATTKRPISDEINKIVKEENVEKIGFENNFTYDEHSRFKKKISAKLVLVDSLIEELRSVKDDSEIESIKKAAALTDKTFTFIKNQIKIGSTEKQIAWEMEKYIRENGGILAFDTIVAFGANSSVPHHLTSDKRLKTEDEFVLLDFGSRVDGYCSDMTRTILTESASDRARKIYEAVLEAQESSAQLINQLIKASKPVDGAVIARRANEVLKQHGFADVPHGLGHGIGLEVHELPHLHPKLTDEILVEENYFSIEPGIYIPGFGGVRIEDDYLMTKNGLEQVTKSPK